MTDPTPSTNAVTLAPGVYVEPGAMRFRFSRSRGPGGQAVNKLSTKAEMRVSVADLIGLDASAIDRLRRMAGARLIAGDELLFQADHHRSQVDNRRACIERLSELVDRARVKPRTRRPSRPSRAMIERRLEEKKQRSQKKQRRSWGESG